MDRRHIASIVAVTLLALTAGCVGALGQTDGTQQPGANESQGADVNRTVTVSATGQVTAEADQAVVRVSVIARADSADAARQQLAANVSTLREALAAANLSDEQITTSGYDIHQAHPEPPRESGGPAGEAELQYDARQSFTITLEDTDRAGEIIDVAVANGATNVRGVHFTLSEDAQADVKREALTDAMDAARRNAETLAAAENLSIDGALHVRTTDVRPVPYAAETAVSADGGGGTTIDGGPVTVTATVEVVYEANEA